MRSCTIGVTFVWCAISSAAGAQPPEAQDIVSAFRAICASGETSQAAELARPDALDWRTTGPNAPKGFDQRTQRLSPAGAPLLVLTTMAETSLGERRDSCGISSLAPVDGLAGAAQRWLGFAPNFAMARSETFIAIRSGDRWRPSPKLDRGELAAVKRQGTLYSVAVLDNGSPPPETGYDVSLVLLRIKAKAD